MAVIIFIVAAGLEVKTVENQISTGKLRPNLLRNVLSHDSDPQHQQLYWDKTTGLICQSSWAPLASATRIILEEGFRCTYLHWVGMGGMLQAAKGCTI
jgi:hypothetical protein